MLFVGVSVICPAAAAAKMAVSEVNCWAGIVLKVICTCCQSGLKPGPSPGPRMAFSTITKGWPLMVASEV
jgi:hypothetical protein